MHGGMSSVLYISLSHLPGQCQRAESFCWAVDNNGKGKGEARDKEQMLKIITNHQQQQISITAGMSLCLP